jgi:SMC interacting uncharacterized protein involved in chromosome segregation
MANKTLTDLIDTQQIELAQMQQAQVRLQEKLDKLNIQIDELTDVISQLQTLQA